MNSYLSDRFATWKIPQTTAPKFIGKPFFCQLKLRSSVSIQTVLKPVKIVWSRSEIC